MLFVNRVRYVYTHIVRCRYFRGAVLNICIDAVCTYLRRQRQFPPSSPVQMEVVLLPPTKYIAMRKVYTDVGV